MHVPGVTYWIQSNKNVDFKAIKNIIVYLPEIRFSNLSPLLINKR